MYNQARRPIYYARAERGYLGHDATTSLRMHTSTLTAYYHLRVDVYESYDAVSWFRITSKMNMLVHPLSEINIIQL